MARTPKAAKPKKIETLTHDTLRANAPTAELQSIAERVEELAPTPPIRFERATPLKAGTERERDKDLDPQIIWQGAKIKLTREQVKRLAETGEVEIGEAQLVWRGKDRQDWSDLVVNAPPIYIQEKIHPKVLIDKLQRQSKKADGEAPPQLDLFADFNGLDPEQRTEFYQHGQHWSNRMILGDSLQVTASLAQREGLRGKVQCIYFDPPYGIKFNSNWQVSTLSRDVKDGKQTDISREPEQIKAFRDTWKDGIHSYLTYLRDRLTVMRELLTESGSIFVQIGDENVHRVRALMDEVFGEECAISLIPFVKTAGLGASGLATVCDYILWYGRSTAPKYRSILAKKEAGDAGSEQYTWIQEESGKRRKATAAERETPSDRVQYYRPDNLTSGAFRPNTTIEYHFQGRRFHPGEDKCWKTTSAGLNRLTKADRLQISGNTLGYVRFISDFPAMPIKALWTDTGTGGFGDDKHYVVQTTSKVVARCILMATDPGDLVLDPTCGSGTTAYVAEQWGRRWITIDTSRVALALARTRLMSARYPFYLLADSKEGREKEMQVSGKVLSEAPVNGDVRLGFVYERAPRVTLGSIANNAEIDVIWETWQRTLEPLREALNGALGKSWQEWEIPREAGAGWSAAALDAHAKWWEARIARQKEIDASIAKNADVELLYDRPYVDSSKIRVAGPFTVESLSPHRVVPADEEFAQLEDAESGRRRRTKFVTPPTDFADLVLEHLRTTGVHQAEKRDMIRFTSVQGWPGEYVNAEARFTEGDKERRAAVFIGPEFGTLSRVDIAAAAREATDGRFDALIACAFNFDAHANIDRLGPMPILKAKMSPDLHMGGELKNTGKGNLFVVFGEPDIDIEDLADGSLRVRVKGIDVFDPNTGEIRSNDTKGIAAWFIDDDYNEESFFVRHAYFLGANDPYKALKTALKAEIDEAAWATLYSDTSRPFKRPSTKKIAVKVINHFGDEVMKVFAV